MNAIKKAMEMSRLIGLLAWHERHIRSTTRLMKFMRHGTFFVLILVPINLFVIDNTTFVLVLFFISACCLTSILVAGYLQNLHLEAAENIIKELERIKNG